MQIGARQRFITAFSAALNNDDALARLLALPMPDPAQESPELTPEQLKNQMRFLKTQRETYTALLWRVRLRKNPYDFPALLNLIDTLDRFGRHELAQKYYEYAYTLINLVPHLQSFLPELRFKQLVSAYSGKLYNNCIDIAQQALPNHPDDLLILGLQAKAMEKLGMQQEARDLLRHAAETAQEKLAAAPQPDPKLQDELAWFFCFIDPDPVLALQYAQAAYQAPSKPPRAAEILAYAQVLNEQYQPAQELLAQTNSDDPIAALAWAMIHLAQKDEPAARKKLESIDSRQHLAS